jgi:hypothetical protein
MKVKIYKIDDMPLTIKPGEKQRQWMDETPGKYAYRCLPLSMANCTGWDLYPNDDFVVSWDGSIDQRNLQINYSETDSHFITSSFGSGIFTVHTGFLFRTEPEWDMLVTGSPNHPCSWASPLSGVVETFWNDFTFTMNWKIHKAGSYTWPKETPICRVLPIPHNYDIVTEVVDLVDEPKQFERYDTWARERMQIIDEIAYVYETGKDGKRVKAGQPKTEWEKDYYAGRRKNGERIMNHNIKRQFPGFDEWKK